MPLAPVAHRLHVVLRGKGFEADGLQRERDEVIDTSKWRNVRPLVDTRLLGPAPHDVIEGYVECPCGRHWLTEEASEAHDCPARVREMAEV